MLNRYHWRLFNLGTSGTRYTIVAIRGIQESCGLYSKCHSFLAQPCYAIMLGEYFVNTREAMYSLMQYSEQTITVLHRRWCLENITLWTLSHSRICNATRVFFYYEKRKFTIWKNILWRNYHHMRWDTIPQCQWILDFLTQCLAIGLYHYQVPTFF